MTTKKTAAATAKSSARKLPVAKPSAKRGATVTEQAVKKGRQRIMRDSFTIPPGEHRKIAEIQAICLKARMIVTKSEVLRAGLKKLAELDAPQLKQAPGSLEKLKTGRTLKH